MGNESGTKAESSRQLAMADALERCAKAMLEVAGLLREVPDYEASLIVALQRSAEAAPAAAPVVESAGSSVEHDDAPYGDAPHDDAHDDAYSDAHGDNSVGDHIDMHTDVHADHVDVPHEDAPHGDAHDDSHSDSHGDGSGGGHNDVHDDSHGDHVDGSGTHADGHTDIHDDSSVGGHQDSHTDRHYDAHHDLLRQDRFHMGLLNEGSQPAPGTGRRDPTVSPPAKKR